MPASTPRPRACELRRKLQILSFAAVMVVAAAGPASAQAPERPAGGHEAPAPGDHAAEAEHGGLSGLLWPTLNFLVLCGGLYYFMRVPFGEYLAARSSQIRKDLTDAAELNRTATAQLADVDRKVKALPGEIDALRARGAQEIAAEETRIAAAAVAERDRLLAQTRREIDARLKTAQRELSEHAASLAIDLARQRLGAEMSPADHTRLVDRYVQQVKGH